MGHPPPGERRNPYRAYIHDAERLERAAVLAQQLGDFKASSNLLSEAYQKRRQAGEDVIPPLLGNQLDAATHHEHIRGVAVDYDVKPTVTERIVLAVYRLDSWLKRMLRLGGKPESPPPAEED